MLAAAGGRGAERDGGEHATGRKENWLTVWHKALQAIGALLLLQTSVKLPEPRGYINDFASVIPAEQTQHIQAIIDDVRAKSGGDIVVVTLADLGDAAPSDVALQIGRQWKVGKFGKPGEIGRAHV